MESENWGLGNLVNMCIAKAVRMNIGRVRRNVSNALNTSHANGIPNLKEFQIHQIKWETKFYLETSPRKMKCNEIVTLLP